MLHIRPTTVHGKDNDTHPLRKIETERERILQPSTKKSFHQPLAELTLRIRSVFERLHSCAHVGCDVRLLNYSSVFVG